MNTLSAIVGIIGVVFAVAYAFFLKLEKSLTGNLGTRQTNPVQGKPGDRIVLNSFFTPVGKLVASASPYTAKIETFLRMNGLQYASKSSDFGTSPNGRLPWLEHGPDVVSDSRFIIRYMLNTYPDLRRQEPSSPEDVAKSTAIQRLCEQHVYFTNLYYGVIPKTAKKASTRYFSNFPWPLPYIVAFAWRTGRATQLRYQGVLTNSEHDINLLIDEDFACLAGFLGDQKYFFGDQPTAADATVFGFLQVPLYAANSSSYLHVSLKKHANLVRFVDSIREEWFADRLAKQGGSKGKRQ